MKAGMLGVLDVFEPKKKIYEIENSKRPGFREGILIVALCTCFYDN